MGTLTAVARRIHDNALVFVTNTHVVSPGVPVTIRDTTATDRYAIDDENAFVYQFLPNESEDATDAEANRVGQLYKIEEVGTGIVHKSWLTVHRKGTVSAWSTGGTSTADLAALKVLPGVTADFGVHDPDNPDDDDHDHPKRPIVAPCLDPLNNMQVTLFGANTGKRRLSILTTIPEDPFRIRIRKSGSSGSILFQHVFPTDKFFIMDASEALSAGGDSGSPVLWVDEDGNYRLVGIFFASAIRGGRDFSSDRKIGYALPAQLAEQLLKVTFGVKAPTAVASAPAKAIPGQWVALGGKDSGSRDPDGDPLTYQWEWILGPTAVPTPMGSQAPPFTFPEQSTPIRNIAVPLHLGTYTYKLTVTDNNGAKASDTVEVKVQSVVARAGSNQAVIQGSTVTLHGSGSTASGGGALTYSWEQLDVPGMPGVTLSSTSVRRPTFTAPSLAGDILFRLTVTNSNGLEDTADVTITVGTSASPTPTPTSNPRPPGNAAPPLPQETPPTPSSSQWDVRYSSNKIQVKVTSLPAVDPAISEVRAYLEAGQPPNLTTVTEAIGTSLNSWITVLSSSDTQWQTGSWAAHIRFENSTGNSAYSDGKSATVPTAVSPPRPRPTPTPETWGPWTDTGVREEDDTVVPRIIWKKQRRTSDLGNTETRWMGV